MAQSRLLVRIMAKKPGCTQLLQLTCPRCIVEPQPPPEVSEA